MNYTKLTPKFEAHISEELQSQVSADLKRQGGKYSSLEQYMRLRSVSQFGQWYQDFATFRNNGYRVKLAGGDWKEIPMDCEPDFESLEAPMSTTMENSEVTLVYSEKTGEMILEVATYRNALAKMLNEINANTAETVYPTAGQWFKEVVFVHAFPIDAKVWLAEQIEPFEKKGKKEKSPGTE